jgi:hypothetical protein
VLHRGGPTAQPSYGTARSALILGYNAVSQGSFRALRPMPIGLAGRESQPETYAALRD